MENLGFTIDCFRKVVSREHRKASYSRSELTFGLSGDGLSLFVERRGRTGPTDRASRYRKYLPFSGVVRLQRSSCDLDWRPILDVEAVRPISVAKADYSWDLRISSFSADRTFCFTRAPLQSPN